MTSTNELTPEERRKVLDILRPAADRARAHARLLDTQIAALDALCEHEMENIGNNGPYTIFRCRHCGRTEAIL